MRSPSALSVNISRASCWLASTRARATRRSVVQRCNLPSGEVMSISTAAYFTAARRARERPEAPASGATARSPVGAHAALAAARNRDEGSGGVEWPAGALRAQGVRDRGEGGRVANRRTGSNHAARVAPYGGDLGDAEWRRSLAGGGVPGDDGRDVAAPLRPPSPRLS